MDYFNSPLSANDPRFLCRFDLRAFLFSVCAIFGYSSAEAGFAQLAAPVGWTTTPAGLQTVTNTTVSTAWRTAANNAVYSTVNASLNVGGKAINVPAALRVAANASTFAARSAFGNPYVFGALLVGSVAVGYFAQKGFFVEDGIWKKRVDGQVCTANCFEYRVEGFMYGPWSPSVSGAVSAWAATVNDSRNTITFVSADPDNSGFYGINTQKSNIWSWETNSVGPDTVTSFHKNLDKRAVEPYDTRTSRPATEEEFITEMAPVPLPAEVITRWPQEVPLSIPVETPIINPAPVPVIDPRTDPFPWPQPLRVPQGVPVPVSPATDPGTWKQPVIDVTPANTPKWPWQVQLDPKDVTSPNPDPSLDPKSVPTPQPNPSINPIANPSPGTDPSETPTPEKTPGLCDMYPDILACSKPDLDTPKEDKLKEEKVNVRIDPDGGWGGGGGSCPAPRHLDGANIDFEYTMVCDFMSGLRPVVIAFAWLAAAMILIGVRSSGGGD